LEKDFKAVLLMDTYSGLLTEKQLRLCDMYYNQDYSLSEIAQIEHTTRQAARDGIGKALLKLVFFESNLGICDKKARMKQAFVKACAFADHEPHINMIIDEISDIWESTDGV